MKYLSMLLLAAVLVACNNAGESGRNGNDSANMQPSDNTQMNDTNTRTGDTASYERMPQTTDSTGAHQH
jgi:hypothetical protein